MTVLTAANSNRLLHWLAGTYPGRLGWMMSPATGFMEPCEWLPYAIDNGKYAAYANKVDWSEDAFFSLLDRCRLSKFKPMWIAVPDEVADRDKTIWLWNQYEFKLRRTYKLPLAFVVQDGMSPRDVPRSADLVFVGGSTKWKWRNAALFSASFPRVHIGRVSDGKLEFCEKLGVESCDGSGFFREGSDGKRSNGLRDFIEGRRHTHPDFFEHGSRSVVES